MFHARIGDEERDPAVDMNCFMFTLRVYFKQDPLLFLVHLALKALIDWLCSGFLDEVFLMCVEWFASPWKQMDGGELGIGFYCLASLLPLLPCRSLYFCHTGLDSLDLVMSAFIHVGWLSLPNSFQWFFFYFIIIVFSGLLNKWFGEN